MEDDSQLTLGMVRQVAEFCQKNSLLAPQDSVVVGVSGGPDSLCLLHILKTLSLDLDLRLIVAHLNHQLRDDAGTDQEFVQEIAARWGLPIRVGSQPVADMAMKLSLSIEATARQIRYDFLGQAASEVGANKVAVGHNADDQAETVLMHFLRGTGLRGLRGMQPATDLVNLRLNRGPSASGRSTPELWLIRPLLESSRADIEAYCRAHRLSPRQDQSNTDITFFRNRLRRQLIPLLESYNPNIKQVLQRTAKLAAADLEILDKQVDDAWDSAVHRESPHRIEFDRYAWLSLPLALKRATLRRAVQRVGHSLRDISFEHIEHAIEVIRQGRTGTQVGLPQGIVVEISYQIVTLTSEPEDSLVGLNMPFLAKAQALAVALPGLTFLPDTRWRLRAELIGMADIPGLEHISQASRWEAYLDADVVGDSPELRTRRPGDSFCPLGMQGHRKKVKQFMIDEKIPAAWRDHIPLLASADQVLWICGYRLGEPARVRPTSRRVWRLSLEEY